MQPVASEGSNRPCLDNEIEEITAKVNSTFYFDIAANKLILYYPSNNVSAILTRNDASILGLQEGSFEQWRFAMIKNGSIDSKTEDLYFGANTIETCNFTAQLSYSQTQRNNLNTRVLKNNCPNS